MRHAVKSKIVKAYCLGENSEMEQQLLQGFTPEEAERFAQYLRRARENLRAVQSHRQKEDVP